MKHEEKSIMGRSTYGHRTPSSIGVLVYHEKKINLALSSLIRGETLQSHLSSSDFCASHSTSI